MSSQTLSTDSGVALITEDKTLSSYGLTGTGATLFLTFRLVSFLCLTYAN